MGRGEGEPAHATLMECARSTSKEPLKAIKTWLFDPRFISGQPSWSPNFSLESRQYLKSLPNHLFLEGNEGQDPELEKSSQGPPALEIGSNRGLTWSTLGFRGWGKRRWRARKLLPFAKTYFSTLLLGLKKKKKAKHVLINKVTFGRLFVLFFNPERFGKIGV